MLAQGRLPALEPHAEPPKSLCDSAYDDLTAESPELVALYERILLSESQLASSEELDKDPLKREKQMSGLVAKRLETMTKEQWRFPLLGRSVNVREQFDRIVKILLVARNFASAAASIDAVHAGLPWAGVCILLPLLVNDSRERKAAADGLEHITRVIRRYTLVEGIYITDECSGLEDELKATIRKLYKHILEYEAKAVCQMDRNTAYQIARNIAGADNWKDMLEGITSIEKTCEQLMQPIDAMNHQRSLHILDENLKMQDQKIEELGSKLLAEMKSSKEEQQNQRLDDQMTECLQALRTSEYESHKERNPNRVDGTCHWVTDHPNYRYWRTNEEANLLWISADPGCGKSVLSKFLVDKELDNKSNTICYFFFKEDNEIQKQGTSALCALLHQLFEHKPALLKHALPAFGQNGEKMRELFDVLWKILATVASDDSSGHIICVLDALDECEEESRFRLIDKLIKYCRTPPDSSRQSHSIKFLVTSRPYFEIENRFYELTQSLPTVQLSGEQETESIRREIDLVIKAEVREIRSSLKLEESTAAYLENKLLSVTNRTYLWLRLMRDEIRSTLASTKSRLEKIIDGIPDTLDATYEAILGRSRDPEQARYLLHIVVAAARPLTLTEMNIALNMNQKCKSYEDLDLEPTEPFKIRIRALCGLFIQIVDSKIYLIHRTAKEFLISSKPEGKVNHDSSPTSWKNWLDAPNSNLIIAKICISYLRFSLYENRFPELFQEGFSEGRYFRAFDYLRQCIKQHALLDYAASYWATHFQRAESFRSAIIESALRIFDTDSTSPPLWFHIFDVGAGQDGSLRNYSSLMMASFLGLEDVITLMLDRAVNIHAFDDLKSTALGIAIDRHHEPVVLVLLDHNTHIESSIGHWNGTALHLAMRYQYEGIVQLLLERGADIEARNVRGETPLFCGGHFTTTQLLLKHGASVGIKNNFGITVLHYAAENYWEEGVIQLLLTQGADIEIQDTLGRTALLTAALFQNLDAIRVFCKFGANIDAKDTNQMTALLHAANMDGRCAKSGRRPRSLSNSRKGLSTENAVDILCKFGANREARDVHGRTALHLAATYQYYNINVPKLCTLGANVEAKDENGMTAFHNAVLTGNDDHVQKLCAHGADVEAKDRHGRTALALAISKWGDGKSINRILLEHGAVDTEDVYGLKRLFC